MLPIDIINVTCNH